MNLDLEWAKVKLFQTVGLLSTQTRNDLKRNLKNRSVTSSRVKAYDKPIGSCWIALTTSVHRRILEFDKLLYLFLSYLTIVAAQGEEDRQAQLRERARRLIAEARMGVVNPPVSPGTGTLIFFSNKEYQEYY